MKMKNNLLGKIGAMQKSNWLTLAPMTLALIVVVLGVTSCATNNSPSGQMKPMSESEHQQMLNK